MVLLSRLEGADSFRFDRTNDGDASSWQVSGAGDINGDGLADLTIEPLADAATGRPAVILLVPVAPFKTRIDDDALNGGGSSTATGATARQTLTFTATDQPAEPSWP